jgi:hypothetical protein
MLTAANLVEPVDINAVRNATAAAPRIANAFDRNPTIRTLARPKGTMVANVVIQAG